VGEHHGKLIAVPKDNRRRRHEIFTGVEQGCFFSAASVGGSLNQLGVQWMTAGRGIVHEEFQSEEFSRKGGTFEMAQLWVNLRARDKGTKPRYQNLLRREIPIVALPENAGTVRVIAGEYGKGKGPARTFTPINLWDVSLQAGKSAHLPLPNGHTSIFLVLSGQVTVHGTDVSEGSLAIFARNGEFVALEAQSDAHLLLMDGEPLNEPVVGRGPFIMNTHAEIQHAFEDYQLGRMGEIPAVRGR